MNKRNKRKSLNTALWLAICKWVFSDSIPYQMPKNELNMGILWLCLCKILSVNAPFCSWCTGYHIMSAAAALIDGVGLYVHLAITLLGVVTNPLIKLVPGMWKLFSLSNIVLFLQQVVLLIGSNISKCAWLTATSTSIWICICFVEGCANQQAKSQNKKGSISCGTILVLIRKIGHEPFELP